MATGLQKGKLIPQQQSGADHVQVPSRHKLEAISSASRNEALGGKAQTGLTSVAAHPPIRQTLRAHSAPGTGLGVGCTYEGGRCAHLPTLPRGGAAVGWGLPLGLWGRVSRHTLGFLSPCKLLVLTPQLTTGLKFLGPSPGVSFHGASLPHAPAAAPPPSTHSWRLQGPPCSWEN